MQYGADYRPSNSHDLAVLNSGRILAAPKFSSEKVVLAPLGWSGGMPPENFENIASSSDCLSNTESIENPNLVPKVSCGSVT